MILSKFVAAWDNHAVKRPGDLLILLTLTDAADANGWTDIKINRIADRSRQTQEEALRSLGRLVSLGLLEQQGSGWKLLT